MNTLVTLVVTSVNSMLVSNGEPLTFSSHSTVRTQFQYYVFIEFARARPDPSIIEFNAVAMDTCLPVSNSHHICCGYSTVFRSKRFAHSIFSRLSDRMTYFQFVFVQPSEFSP